MTPNWWENLGQRPSVPGLVEYDGHAADISSDHVIVGLALVDEARAKLSRFNAARAS